MPTRNYHYALSLEPVFSKADVALLMIVQFIPKNVWNYVAGRFFGNRYTATTKRTDVFLRYADLVLILIITTIPITAVVMSQSEIVWKTLGGVFSNLIPDSLYTRMLVAQCYAGAAFVGTYWTTFAPNVALIFGIGVSNWIKLLG